MPSKSAAQHRLMEAAAHTPGGYGGVPQSVGQEYASADKASGNYMHAGKPKKSPHERVARALIGRKAY